MPGGPQGSGRLGTPRVHLRETDSTNTVARELAGRGAPHGTLITADQQTAGRGRQGRAWSAPLGASLLCSWVIRDPSRLLSLAAGLAVAELAGDSARVKWPNDVLIERRKLSGILVEGRPQERWAVLGIGVNVATRLEQLPAELRDRAATLGLAPADVEPTLARLRDNLERWLSAADGDVLQAVRALDALRDQPVRWTGGAGTGAGIDDGGRLLVALADGSSVALDAGEVHLGSR
ncbi:MAG TPA: biotin--[acetyl-CoA-carboxylase] ligase [Solirubrobacteraceae bacterium]|jgi:BirA family biotin operon repressor/biotin-[acetyl-CoA-carboxylase] ligase|nr:biotin--[acetyl-CoA-carboxylase] ligase [Solirubrobacteraceae bacterium]